MPFIFSFFPRSSLVQVYLMTSPCVCVELSWNLCSISSFIHTFFTPLLRIFMPLHCNATRKSCVRALDSAPSFFLPCDFLHPYSFVPLSTPTHNLITHPSFISCRKEQWMHKLESIFLPSPCKSFKASTHLVVAHLGPLSF